MSLRSIIFMIDFFYNRKNSLNIQSSIDNIQLLQITENIHLQFSSHKMHKNSFKDLVRQTPEGFENQCDTHGKHAGQAHTTGKTG